MVHERINLYNSLGRNSRFIIKLISRINRNSVYCFSCNENINNVKEIEYTSLNKTKFIHTKC
jgi:hypothetical protein